MKESITQHPETSTLAITSLKSLAVIIPVYNSESTIGKLVDRLVEVISPTTARLEIILVNDKSRDKSHEASLKACQRHPDKVVYLRLARNFGEHNAVMCGLKNSTADAAVIIDDDFQNPPEEILKLVNKLQEGFDVVYSAYETKKHNWARNLGSRFNDAVATRLLKKPKTLYLSSFKALNRFLIDAILTYEGPYPYIDGLILRSTSSISSQLCAHEVRKDGKSNYTLRRLIRLWLNMSTSFSIIPLRIASLLGLIMSGLGFCLAILFIISKIQGGVFISDDLPPGWASTIVSITIFAGVQLCMLGLIGEYLGRLFLTQNRQPQFVVREKFDAQTPAADDV